MSANRGAERLYVQIRDVANNPTQHTQDGPAVTQQSHGMKVFDGNGAKVGLIWGRERRKSWARIVWTQVFRPAISGPPGGKSLPTSPFNSSAAGDFLKIGSSFFLFFFFCGGKQTQSWNCSCFSHFLMHAPAFMEDAWRMRKTTFVPYSFVRR